MSSSINKAIISGRLTRDAELRNTNGTNTAVLNFSVAVNDRRQNKQTGEWEDHANYIDCSIFGTRAEKLASMLQKGTKVCVAGKLRQSQWEDKETGKKRSSISILVDDIEIMFRTEGGGNGGGGSYSAPADDAPASDSYAADDDVPF